MNEHYYPNDVNAEISLLGAILLDNDVIDNTTVTTEMFYNQHLGYLYGVMQKLRSVKEPIDVVTLASGIPRKQLDEIGGMGLLMKLSDSTPTTSNFEGYDKIIRNTYKERTAVITALKVVEGIRQGEGLENVASDIVAMQDVLIESEEEQDGDIVPYLVSMHERFGAPIESGVKSGFASLDAVVGGLQEQDLNIVAARPGMGKTAVMVQDAINRVKHNEKTLAAIFSLEMSTEKMLERFITNIGLIDNHKNRNPYEMYDVNDWRNFSTAIGMLSEMPIRIFDKGMQSVESVRATLRKLQKAYPDYKILVYIDYIQLMHGDKKGNREQEVSSIARGLKLVAKDFNTTVIALAQLSRSCEQRQDKRPLLSDLRESGSLEQDSSVVTFLYRDEYYDENSEDKGVLEQIVAKNRHGATGTVKFAFMAKHSMITELERVE